MYITIHNTTVAKILISQSDVTTRAKNKKSDRNKAKTTYAPIKVRKRRHKKKTNFKRNSRNFFKIEK